MNVGELYRYKRSSNKYAPLWDNSSTSYHSSVLADLERGDIVVILEHHPRKFRIECKVLVVSSGFIGWLDNWADEKEWLRDWEELKE